jgi:FtsP/CotA-like multicopper oxidase with cupredoxin domain
MITSTPGRRAFVLVVSAAAAMPVASFAASPVFVNPDTFNANNPFVLTAQSPAQPYSIDGFPGTVDGLFLYRIDNALPSLRPKLWRTQPGKTLAFELKNKLPCTPSDEPGNPNRMRRDQTNVHLHGLVVPPNARTGGASGTYGDNSMLVVDSINKGCLTSTAPMTMGAHPHETGGTAAYRIKLPADHPYGLSWYHPHVHEVAGFQVGSGMSGLISIGNVWSYAYAKYSSENVGAAEERLYTGAGAQPSTSRKSTEQALRQRTQELYLMLKDLQVVQTQPSPLRYRYNTEFSVDLCGGADAPKAVCSSASGDSKWLFMVNGQVFPAITIHKGDRHVWRMANVGATVSYKLRLKVTAPAASAGTIIPMQVLVSDGVAFEQLKSNANWQQSVTMMPSARAEVHIDPMHICRVLAGRPLDDRAACTLPQDVEAVLETNGIETGADKWPNAGLAQVKIKAFATYEAASDPGPMGVSTVRDPAASASAVVADSTPPCANPSTILPTQYRLIGVKNETRGATEFFGMATQAAPGQLNATGKPQDTTLPPSAYKSFDAGRVDLCIGANIQQKYGEKWVIKNDAQEIHNFHVHQAKFKVLDFYPTKDLLVPMRTGPNVFHDNFPINPGQWVMVEVTFDHKEQVGRYMYHCHILEHEDKGMMSVIQVVDTSTPVASAPRSAPGLLTAAAAPKGWRARTAARASSGGLDSADPLLVPVNARAPATTRVALKMSADNRSSNNSNSALENYRASAPPWMAQAICTTPSSKGL